MKKCCDEFKLVGLLTNGLLLNDYILEIMKNGRALLSVEICLDGPDKRTVDETSNLKGSYEKIINAIKLVKKHGIILRVGMVIDSYEKVSKMEDTLILARALGADSFVATPAINYGRASDTLLTEEFNERFFEEHFRLKRIYREYYSREGEIIDPEKMVSCGAGQRQVTVNWDGEIKICSMQPIGLFTVGNVYDMSNGSVQYKFKKISELIPPKRSFCKSCKYIYYCMNCYIRPFNLFSKNKIKKEECAWYLNNESVILELES